MTFYDIFAHKSKKIAKLARFFAHSRVINKQLITESSIHYV